MMVRKCAVLIALLVAVAMLPMPVGAAGLKRPAFCSSDPIYMVDGQKVSVLIELAPLELASGITPDSPVVVHLEAPRGTDPVLWRATGSFPEVATASERGNPHKIKVSVTVPKSAGNFELMIITIVSGERFLQREFRTRNAQVQFDWD
jgi:hypothetical protein